MTAERGRAAERGGMAVPGRPSWGATGRRLLFWSTVVVALVMAGFVCATLLAPRLTETLQPGSIQPDGDHAYTLGFSLEAPWPYVVPSHPDYGLTAGDATLSEDGVPIGILEPSHAEIRRLGAGRYDLWQGSLWFSTSGPDPREPGHRYTVSVVTRLDPTFAAARLWCAFALLALVAVEIGRAAASAGSNLVFSETWLWRLRWRFRAPFLVVTFGLLAGFAILASRQPLRFVFLADSYAYIEPGLRLADGQSMAGTSVRDLGYPILAFLAVRLGSLADLVPIQLGLVMLAMACMLLVMSAFFHALLRTAGFAAGRVPVLFTAGLSAMGLLYALLLFSHDGFVLDISSLMAEAPHFLPMAAALLCFAAGWAARSGGIRISLMALATGASLLSTVVKPSSLMAFALCATSLAAACILHRRRLSSPAVIAALVLTVLGVVGLRELDAWATPRDDDFGAKVLFCNHLDVVDAHLGPTTPERAAIKSMIAHVFSMGPRTWPLQGFDGDQCTFVQEFTDAITAAARSEGTTSKNWQLHEMAAAVLAHPLLYARHVVRQLVHFGLHPVQNADQTTTGHLTDEDWSRLTAFGSIKRLQRGDFDVELANWFGTLAPDLVHTLKGGLRLMALTFALVAVASTALALRAVVRMRQPAPPRAEVILLSVGAFTFALPLTVALSHTFDVGRYSVDILPFTLLWWCMGLVYLVRAAARAAAL